jgi:protein kinase-like protein
MVLCGRYELEREIGRGAMGVVHLALDRRLGRRVALKTLALPDGISENQRAEFQQRFRREAHAAAGLAHPAIVTVHDADEDPDSGTPFIVMEYVEGRSLRDALEQDGSLAPDYAVRLAADVASGLGSAHEAGIVHRDLKPANLLIRESDGAVKIADFGVARVRTSELTQSGTSMGTPCYMSPEQIGGRPVDGRSDLFALAVILYEALCGARPFDGETVPAVVYAVANETPLPPGERVAGLPAALDRFFERALAKHPDDRFPSAASFRAALVEAWQERERAGVPPTVRLPAPTATEPGPSRLAGRRRRMQVAAAALLLLLVVVTVFVVARKEAHLQLQARSAVAAGELALFVDGDPVYSRSLAAPSQPKGWLKKIIEQNQETFEAWIPIDSGKHEVTAEIRAGDADRAWRDTIVVDLEPGETRRLRLVAGRSVGALSLKLD